MTTNREDGHGAPRGVYHDGGGVHHDGGGGRHDEERGGSDDATKVTPWLRGQISSPLLLRFWVRHPQQGKKTPDL